jgi:aspartyl/asparaginyl beta-hydroxylase (cupin superfamily)
MTVTARSAPATKKAHAPTAAFSDPGMQYKDHTGRVQFLSYAEFQAVERSGRSSLQHYMHNATVWPSEPTYHPIDLMNERPNPVEPGTRPTEEAYVAPRNNEPLTDIEQVFLRRMPHMTAAALGGIIHRSPRYVNAIRISFGMFTHLNRSSNTQEEIDHARELWWEMQQRGYNTERP